MARGEIAIYPQTHVYFAEMVLGRTSDAITLGSLFPDMVISSKLNHARAHSMGQELFYLLRDNRELADFARGAISHGISPCGLDYFGDEKYPGYERGYCFEKGRALVAETIEACNIPPQMGWWKAHNIVEMGIELRVSALDTYGRTIRRAFNNQELIDKLGDILAGLTGNDARHLKSRISGFSGYIEVFRATPQSLANKYRIQMFARHRININTAKVARLIEAAAERVEDDLEHFFLFANNKVLLELTNLERQIINNSFRR